MMNRPIIQSVDSRYDKPYFMGRWMHPPTLVLESVDASTDSVNRVGGCIHRLYVQSGCIHPPTLKLELVDASTDSTTRVDGCIHHVLISPEEELVELTRIVASSSRLTKIFSS